MINLGIVAVFPPGRLVPTWTVIVRCYCPVSVVMGGDGNWLVWMHGSCFWQPHDDLYSERWPRQGREAA